MLWNARNGSVPVGNTEMCYVSFGQGEKPFIILPGLSDGLMTVKGKALMLAKPYKLFFENFTVYMFSRKNDLPVGISIADMAEDQAQAMEILGLKNACVMGVSQGGMVAQALAVSHPELVEKLVLTVTAPCVNSIIRECADTWIGFAKQGDHKSLMIDTAEKTYSPAYLKKYRKIYPVIGTIGKPSDYGRFLANANAILSFDVSASLEKITCPTLIIGGDEDRIVGIDASYDLKKGIKDSEIYVYKGLGHAVYEEASDFNERVFRFLTKDPV